MMYVEDPRRLYACFRCGSIGGDVKVIDSETALCGECGENGLITFIQALDMLNHFHAQGALPAWEEDFDYEIPLDEEDTSE